MYFLNTLFSQLQLFLYFFWSWEDLDDILHILYFVNLLQYCCIGIF